MGKTRFENTPHSHLSFLKSFIIIALGCTAILFLCLIDYLLTGDEITFSLLYLIPVGITVWLAGITGGVITSVLSTLTWFFIYINGKGPAEITAAIIINFILKLSLYLCFSYLLFRLKQNLALEKKLSGTDPLTNAMNRRAFFNVLKSEIARSSRYGHPVSLVYFDIDNFKKINDHHGHAEGDRLLKKISETVKSSLRNTDFLARMGGDEFAVLLPETGYADARKAVESLNEDLNEMADK